MLKTGGMLLIISAFTFSGFYKADLLKKRSKRLTEICIGLERLSGFIKNGSGDLAELLKLSFSEEQLNCREQDLGIKEEYLLKEDTEILRRLLNELGISDRETEEKRVRLYKSLMEKQQNIAEDRVAQLNKLYTSLGFLTGLLICIFLI